MITFINPALLNSVVIVMVLSDYDIHGMIRDRRLVIKPLGKDSIRENGVDFRLANEIAHHKEFGDDFILDPMNKEHISSCYNVVKNPKSMVIAPYEQTLLSTLEFISMPDDVAGFVELRSTWARHGLSMPPTIIDAGFKGTITLEVVNNAPYKILLRPRQRFAHIVFIRTSSKVLSKYSGFYSGQRGIKLPQPAK